MLLRLIDNPLIRATMFFPRAGMPGTSLLDRVHDGTIPVEGGIRLGYRFYVHEPGAPVIVYFHGNGEIAGDYDGIAPLYHDIGVSLLVVDYRGYGWSTGRPRLRGLLTDTTAVRDSLPDVLAEAGLVDVPLFVMGRSLGSAPAIHMATEYPDLFTGLIVESGFAHAPSLFGSMLGLPRVLLRPLSDPIGNRRKMASITLPLLIIHGERDRVVHVSHGQQLYDASPAKTKHIQRLAGVGHNDLMLRVEQYFQAVARFVAVALQRKRTGHADTRFS